MVKQKIKDSDWFTDESDVLSELLGVTWSHGLTRSGEWRQHIITEGFGLTPEGTIYGPIIQIITQIISHC